MNEGENEKHLRRKTVRLVDEKKRKRIGWTLFTGLLLAAVLVFLSFANIYIRIRGDLEQMAMETIRGETEQTADNLSVALESRFVFLENLARDIAKNPASVRELIGGLDVYAEGYHIKRAWFMDESGWGIISNGAEDDFSYRDYFRKAIHGEPIISGILNDTLFVGEQINIMCIPVYDASGKIIGVVGATYDAQVFRELLNVDSFEETGYGYIVDASGNIIAESSNAKAGASDDAQ